MKKYFRIYEVRVEQLVLYKSMMNWFYTLESAETHVAHLIKTDGGAYSILTIYEK